MVRNIAGVLMAVGAGDKPVEWVDSVLQARDRRQEALRLKPHGLYLADVDYPEEFGIPKIAYYPLLYVISNTHWKPSFNKLACVLVSIMFRTRVKNFAALPG